ncbi:MAG: GNAT family N-acetyltransferase [Candidatus Thorarchaeota archaeon]
MIEIRFNKLSQEDCKKLAALNIETRRGTPVQIDSSLEDITKSIENLSTSEGFRILTAHSEGNIVGWLYYYVQFPLMTFISGYYPVVDSDSEEIAKALIQAAKRETVERGHTRLEIEIVFPTQAHREYSKKLVNMYTKCGFQFAAEEIHMKCDLSTAALHKIDTLEGYAIKRFSDASYERLEEVGFRTLKESKEGLFLSMSHDEQIVTLQYFFDRSNPYIDDASLILERDGKIVGFVITRIGDDGEPDIGPVGLVPELRGKGLASFLLTNVLKNLRDSGSNSVSLDTTVINTPAQKLYRKFGFKDIHHKQFYYWSPQ